MNSKQIWNASLPHILVVLGFFIISFIYTSPVLQGKKLAQNDIIQAKSAALPLHKYHKENKKLSLWADNMFSGMPAYMVYIDYPNSLTTKLGRFFANLLPSPTVLIFLSFIGFYVLMVVLKYNPYVSAIGAIAFTFASYNILNIGAGHISKVLAIALAPPMIASVILTYRGKYLLGGALSALFAGIQLYANHIQITYYIFLALLIFAIFKFVEAIKEKKLKEFGIASGVLIIAGIFAIGSHYSRIITTYEYSKQSIRGKSDLKSNKQSKGGLDRNYAFDWSYGKLETMTTLIPNFYGGGAEDGQLLDEKSNTYKVLSDRISGQQALNLTEGLSRSLYWGKQPFTAGPAYFGAIIIFLFVFSLLITKHWIKWWLLAVTIFFIILSWGKNLAFFNYFMFDYFPLYNKFRAVTMLLAVVQIFVAWMVVLGLQEIFTKKLDKKYILKKLYISVGVVGGIVFFFTFLSGMFLTYKTDTIKKLGSDGSVINYNKDKNDQILSYLLKQDKSFGHKVYKALQKDRASKLFYDGTRSLVYILLAALIIWLFINNANFQKYYLIGGLAVLILADMVGVCWRYLNNEDYIKKSEYKAKFEPNNIDQAIHKQKGIYRVLNLGKSPFNDATTSAQHKSIGGYHGAKLRRYQELIDAQFEQNVNGLHAVANMKTLEIVKSDSIILPMFNMLNVQQIVLPISQEEKAIFKNTQALGNAWFVKEYKIAKDADEAIKSLSSFNPEQTAIIEKSFEKNLKGFTIGGTSGTIKITNYQPDKITYTSNAEGERLAVFSEIYYVNKGKSEWKVKIDGKEVEHIRANYVLRALKIPKGKHTIVFEFKAPVFESGETFALIFSILIVIFLVFAIFIEIKGFKKQNTTST